MEPSEIGVAVITVSDRAAGGAREDRSGPLLVSLLREAGYQVTGPRVVSDGVEPVTTALQDAIDEAFLVVITTGGTGVSPRDHTPEATSALVTRALPGVAEHLRREGARHTPLAALSRGVVGVVDTTDEARRAGRPGALLVNLPGSVNGVRESVPALLPLLPHLVAQIRGWDH